MSPQVGKLGGLKIFIHTRDHKPAHVHIEGPEVEVKIEISSWKVIYCSGLNTKSLKKLIQFLKEIENDLWEVWNEIHE